ncbi:hypothetical protein JL722_8562 [Aureococcus anophagefferens]|nr:hypothetical protein JL722_8562 [Aureococcus anophagefferens]
MPRDVLRRYVRPWATKATSCAELEEWGCDCFGCACAVEDGDKNDDKGGDWGDKNDDKGGDWGDDKDWGDKDGDWGDKDGYTAAPTATLTGSWRYSGMMLFFHGAGGGASVRHAYRVAENADTYGFVGVVPIGSPGDGEDGGKRRLAEGDTECCYYWNVDVADGVDDVGFVHAVVAAVAEDYAVAADRPVIALGFSNGAGMSELLLGCHDSYDLWVAHLGVHYRPESDWPSTCQSKYSDCPEWNAVGSEDWFLDGLSPTPTEGILAQFEASRDAAGCPEEAARQDGECYEYASCPSLGRLCVYDGVIHMITDTMTESAWTYLTGPGLSCGESAATTQDGWCADSGVQLCKMLCETPDCPTGQCAMRVGTCCDYTCAYATRDGDAGPAATKAPTSMWDREDDDPADDGDDGDDGDEPAKSCDQARRRRRPRAGRVPRDLLQLPVRGADAAAHGRPSPAPSPSAAPSPGLAFGEFAENATTTEAFAAECPKTCFFDTCDAWATAETTCEVLEREYDCDCAGCACDGTGSVKDDDKGGDKDGDWGDKDGYTAAPTATLTGSWRVESLGNAGGATRAYWVYAPDAAEYSGMMLFFHGADGGASVRHAYRVAENADTYGFVGVVPIGSPGDGGDGGKGDGGKRRLEDGTECCYHWNVDDADGVDEISFVHAVVAEVAADYAVGADKPVIALGFSNGAAMSELLGCHDSHDFRRRRRAPEWNAVGTEDEFLDGLSPTPTEGILAQFEAGRDAAGCPEEAARASRGGECHDYPSCPSLGVLCVYDGVIHMITDTMTESAWTYLTGPGLSCGESETTTTKAKKDRCAKKTKKRKCSGNCVWKRGAKKEKKCTKAGCAWNAKKEKCADCAKQKKSKKCKKAGCKWKKKKETCLAKGRSSA